MATSFPIHPQVNGTFHLFECPVVHEMRDNECVCLQASFILWIRDIPTGRVMAPYRGTKYHLPEFQQGPMPRGKKDVFNFAHSSLRNVIERSFGVLKNK